MSVASMKEDRRLKNRELRRKDPTIRQIKNGKVTKKYEVTPYEVSRESLMKELKEELEGDRPLIFSPADTSAVVDKILLPPEPTQEVAPAEVSTPVEVSASTVEVVTPVEEPATVEVSSPAEAPAPEEVKE